MQLNPENLLKSLPRRTASSAQSQQLNHALQSPPPNATKSEVLDHFYLLKAEVLKLRSERNRAEAHAIMSIQENQRLKLQLSNKKSGRRRNIKTSGELITGNEARERRAAENALRDAKEAKKQAAKERRETRAREEAERQYAQAADPMFAYQGLLKNQKHGNMVSILKELALPSSGSKAILLSRLEAYFRAHPETMQVDRYAGLFRSARQRRSGQTITSDTI